MIGAGYWATGISLRWDRNRSDVSASIAFLDGGWCQNDSTEGELRLRYFVPAHKLADALDVLIADAKRLGIDLGRVDGPTLYVPQDGEDPKKVPPNWREIVARESARLGWRDIYAELAAAR